MLSAVTAQIAGFGTNDTEFWFRVEYSSDRPIDSATINGDELRLFKSSGSYDVTPELRDFGLVGNTAFARYRVRAPADHGTWSLADNGHYTLQLLENAVENTSGEGNAAADVRTFSLWFPGAHVSLVEAPLDVYGRGYTGLPDASGRVAVSDEARFDIRYETLTLSGSAQRTMVVTLAGPNGYSQTTSIAFANSQFTARAGGGYQAIVPVRFSVPGQTWDPSDGGLYSVTITPEDLVPGAVDALRYLRVVDEFEVTPRGVKAEIASTSISTGEMLVTMKYSHPAGINLATITTGDVKVTIPGQGTFSPTLVGSPTVVDGVVTAVYRLAEPAGGWAAVAGGKVTVRTGLQEVRAGNGETVGFAVTRTLNVASGGRIVGTVKSAYTTASKLVVVMRFGNDQAVDPSTLGDNDLRLTGPNGYNQLGELIEVLPQAGGEVLGVYHFHAPDITWDFRTDNGAYVLSVEPDAVREVNAGDVNVAGNVRTFGLWFNSPVVEMVTPAHVYHGTAAPNSMFDNTDAARVVVRYTTREYRTSHVMNHALTARITGPNGFSSTQTLPNNWIPGYRSVGLGDGTEVDLRFAPPGGGWDSSDNGLYTITVLMNRTAGNPNTEVLFEQQLNVTVARPRAELVDMVTSSTTLTAIVRYDGAPIDAATISSSDLVLINRINGIGFSNSWAITMEGSLVSPPQAGPSGSFMATYRFTSPNSQPWFGMSRASLVVKPQEVRDAAGNAIGAALLSVFELPPGQPDVISTGTLSASRTAWEVEVILRNDRGLIQTSSLQPSNLIVSAPDGRTTRVFMTSFVTALDGTLRVRYKVTSPISGSWLANGAYTLAIAPSSISQGLAGYLPATTLGTFNMTFS
jgi:hypothetical protein